MQSDYPRNTTNAVYLADLRHGGGVCAPVCVSPLVQFGHESSRTGSALTVSGVKVRQGLDVVDVQLPALHEQSAPHRRQHSFGPVFHRSRSSSPCWDSDRFFWLFSAAVMAGAVLWLASHWRNDRRQRHRCDRRILGLISLYSLASTRISRMTFLLFFVLPVTLEAKYVAIGLLVGGVARVSCSTK